MLPDSPRNATLVYEQDQGASHSQSEDEPMIQTLPADVLREIFRRCLPLYKYQESIHFEVDKPPYTLAKVCRHWRSVCLSTALLWVDFPMFTNETPDVSEFSRHWKTKLVLSSPCDLRLYINHYSGFPETNLINAFGQIHPSLTFPRVRTLDLCADSVILRAISQHTELFKRLQILKINLIDYFSDPIHLPQLDFQSKVTSLSIQSRNKRAEVSQSLLKCVETLLPSLTKFDGDNLPASSLPEILAVARLLTELKIRNLQAASASAPVCPPLIHTHLKILHLTCKPPRLGNAGVFPIDLSPICLPELEDLIVQYPLQTARVSSSFLSFLQHTQGSLRNLYIGGVLESSYDQKAMYDLCPRLETLTMAHANDESLKHLALTSSSGNRPMCPRLRHLTLLFFRLNSELEVGLQTIWLSQLTSCRFGMPNDPIESVPLENLTVVLTKSSNFLHFQGLQDFNLNLSYFLSTDSSVTPAVQQTFLAGLEKVVEQNLYSICLLDDLKIISYLKEFAGENPKSFDYRPIHEKASVLHAHFMALLVDIRGKPHWKREEDATLRKKLEKFVFKNHLVCQ